MPGPVPFVRTGLRQCSKRVMKNLYQILEKCPLFRGMNAAGIKDVLGQDSMTITSFAKGDTVAHRDTAYSGLMIILEGRVVGTFTYPSGQTVNIEAIEAPELIAPAFLFGGYNRLPVDVIAQTDLKILTLHRGYLFELMQENMLILSNFIDIISNRAGVWQKKIYALSFKTLKEKLASYLLDHSSENNPSVPVPDTHEIAEYFAATRSSLLSVIEDMEKKHIIRKTEDIIEILNRRALTDILK